MVPKTVQIECPNGVKTKTRKKHVPKSTKIGKVSKKVPKRDPKKITELIFFWVFFGIGALWAPTWPPEPPKEAQGSLQEAILSHFWSNFHLFSTHLCSIFLNICMPTASPQKGILGKGLGVFSTVSFKNNSSNTSKKHSKMIRMISF